MKRRLLAEMEAQIALLELELEGARLDIDRNMAHAKRALLEKIKIQMEGYPIQ